MKDVTQGSLAYLLAPYTLLCDTPLTGGRDMTRYEYEHTFIQHLNDQEQADIPMGVAEGLNAWGADGWDVVHMEAQWGWRQDIEGKSWPESLHGYYVTLKRESMTHEGPAVATAAAELLDEVARTAPAE